MIICICVCIWLKGKSDDSNYFDDNKKNMAFSSAWTYLRDVLKEHDGYDGKIPEGVKPWEYK